MKATDLRGREGDYVYVRDARGERGLGRLEGLAAPEYPGDRRTVRVRRFQAGGPFTARVSPRDVLEITRPDERTLRVIAVIEEES